MGREPQPVVLVHGPRVRSWVPPPCSCFEDSGLDVRGHRGDRSPQTLPPSLLHWLPAHFPLSVPAAGQAGVAGTCHIPARIQDLALSSPLPSPGEKLRNQEVLQTQDTRAAQISKEGKCCDVVA